jgi:hypothetical protein
MLAPLPNYQDQQTYFLLLQRDPKRYGLDQKTKATYLALVIIGYICDNNGGLVRELRSTILECLFIFTNQNNMGTLIEIPKR